MNNNLEMIRKVYQAFAAGDIPAVLARLSPTVQWTEAQGGPYGGVYVGPESVLDNVFKKLGGEWESFTVHPGPLHDAGDVVVVEGRYTGTFLATKKRLDAQFCHVWTLRDGKIAKFQQYADTGQLQAVMTP